MQYIISGSIRFITCCVMNKDKKQGITWFEPFSEKEANTNEGTGLLRRFLKRPQRSTVQIDAQKQSVKFEKSAVESKPASIRISSSEAEVTGGDSTSTNTVYSSPPRAVSTTLSTVIDRLDTLGRSKVLYSSMFCHKYVGACIVKEQYNNCMRLL